MRERMEYAEEDAALPGCEANEYCCTIANMSAYGVPEQEMNHDVPLERANFSLCGGIPLALEEVDPHAGLTLGERGTGSMVLRATDTEP